MKIRSIGPRGLIAALDPAVKHGRLKYEEPCGKRGERSEERSEKKVSIGSAVRIAFFQPRMSPPIVDLTGSCVVTVKAIGSSVRLARNLKKRSFGLQIP